MSFIQPTTKQEINEINHGLASTSIFSNSEDAYDQKTSQSPTNTVNNRGDGSKRAVVFGRRRFNSNGQKIEQNISTNNNNGNLFNGDNSNNNINNNNNNNSINNSINNNHDIYAFRQSRNDRLKRKRKFDVMQTGSNELATYLNNAQRIKLPNLSLCYVRRISLPFGVYNDKNILNGNNNNNANKISDNNSLNATANMQTPPDDQKTGATNDYFSVLMQASQKSSNEGQNGENGQNGDSGDNVSLMNSMDSKEKDSEDISMTMETKDNNNNNNNSNENSNDNDIQMSRLGAPLRNPDLTGIQDEWVTVFTSYDAACNDSNWKIHNKCGKIEEYQIKSHDTIYILNLDSININNNNGNCIDFENNKKSIENFMLSNGFSGYLYNNEYRLHNPFKYWRLVDDNKTKKLSQWLISDMLQREKKGKP